MRKSTILVIDDSPLICSVVQKTMEEDDIHVFTAATGEEGIKLALDHQPDLILLDIVLMHMSGFDVFKHLQMNAKTQSIPVIFITSTNDSQNVVKCFELGAVDYISHHLRGEPGHG